eukprot:1835067-Amphidinium_carterae.3
MLQWGRFCLFHSRETKRCGQCDLLQLQCSTLKTQSLVAVHGPSWHPAMVLPPCNKLRVAKESRYEINRQSEPHRWSTRHTHCWDYLTTAFQLQFVQEEETSFQPANFQTRCCIINQKITPEYKLLQLVV